MRKGTNPNLIELYKIFESEKRPLSIKSLRPFYRDRGSVDISNMIQALKARGFLLKIGKEINPDSKHQVRYVFAYIINPEKTLEDLTYQEPDVLPDQLEPGVPCQKTRIGNKLLVRFGKGHRPGSGQGRLVGPAIGAGTMASVMAQGGE